MQCSKALCARIGFNDRNLLLRVVNAHYRLGQAANAKVLATLAADNTAQEAARKEALTVLGAWANPSPKDRLLYLWRPLPNRNADDATAALTPVISTILANGAGAVQESAATTAAKLGLKGASDALLAIVANDQAGKSARVEALRALAKMKDARLAQAAKEAITDRDPKLRAEGLKALVASDPTAALKTIAEVLSSNASAAEKQGAVAALAESRTPEAERLIGSLMDDLIAGKLVPEVQLDVYEAARKRPGLASKIQQWTAAIPKGSVSARSCRASPRMNVNTAV